MTNYPITNLGEIVEEFRYGTSVKSSPSGDPVLRIPNVIGGSIDYTDLKYVTLPNAERERLKLEEGDLLFVRSNGNPDFVGRCSVFKPKDQPVVFASYLIRARLLPKANPYFVQWYLASKVGREALRTRARTSAGQFNLNTVSLATIPIPLPPMPEQRRVVDVLNHAASIRRLRDEAQAKVREVVPALFVDMFGNPATNPKEWPMSTLDAISHFISGGTLPLGRAFEGQEGGRLLIKVGDMNLPGNENSIVASREWSDGPVQRSSIAPAGSVVFPKRGGAIATNKKRLVRREAVLDPNLMAVAPDQTIIVSQYLYAWFLMFDLREISSGTTVPQLNKQDLAPLEIAIPPLSIQHEFAERVAEVEGAAVLSDKAVLAAEQLTQSLLAQLFGRAEPHTTTEETAVAVLV